MKKSSTIGKTIKAELSAAFKGIKFSVRYSSFAGGDSVDISWEFGPTTKEVEAISNKYQAGNFDGMTDSYTYAKEGKAEVTAKYVQTSRTFSNEFKLDAAAAFCEKVGIETQRNLLHTATFGDLYVSQIIHRILSKTSFQTSAPEFTAVEHCQSDFVILFSEIVNSEKVLPKLRFQLYPTAVSTVECPVIAEASEIIEEIKAAYIAWDAAATELEESSSFDRKRLDAKERAAYKKFAKLCLAAGLRASNVADDLVRHDFKAHNSTIKADVQPLMKIA